MSVSTGPFTNKLQFETSPYLLQHAAQPVDWMPWSEEAFSLAAKENKPVFLSIGYSACHWCHVMAEESFADPDLARLMNRVFVNIKVDREERPDIDQVYMTVCHMMTGSGGWPLTIVMMPDKRPVFAATYLPKRSTAGRPGMHELCLKIEELWQGQHEKIEASAAQIAEALQRVFVERPASGGSMDSKEVMDRAFDELRQRYDADHGGFGMAPKFPSAHNLLFLLRYWQETDNEQAREMVRQTLTKMRQGGIYDQIGYGFHRYSTDRSWKLPHFEKMLYDQALLILTYSEASSCFADQDLAQTARQTIFYVMQSLHAPDGGFFSAEDADSEGEEGKFYTWNTAEIRSLLNDSEAALAIEYFSLQDGGNFAEESTGSRTGANVLLGTASIHDLAAKSHQPEATLQEEISCIKSTLLARRRKRAAPSLDDKILTDWNGLMIAALAKASRIFKEPSYAHAAEQAADFILQHSRYHNLLSHSYCKGRASTTGFLDDYAFFAWGLYELYQSTFEDRFLAEAFRITEEMARNFIDANTGGLFFSRPDAGELFLTPKQTADGALFSGASVALFLLRRFTALTEDKSLRRHAENLSRYLGDAAQQATIAHLGTLLFSNLSNPDGPQITICGSRGQIIESEILAALRNVYRPNLAIYWKTDDPGNILHRIAPHTSSYKAIDGKATAYLCMDRNCLPPITNADELSKHLSAEKCSSCFAKERKIG